MFNDMNERSARPARQEMPPLEIPVWVPGQSGPKPLHLVTDDELERIAAGFNCAEEERRMAGWRWARSCAWLLAGNPPREWTAD